MLKIELKRKQRKLKFLSCVKMSSFRKYPYSPHRRGWKFQEGGGGKGGVPKAQNFFKAMYKAKLEFPEA